MNMNSGLDVEDGEAFVRRQRQRRYQKLSTSSRSLIEPTNFDREETHYFGVIQLSLSEASQILSNNPPPPEYVQLSPIERAAYLYYFMLYRKYLTPVASFHNVFNREFYKYISAGDTDVLALWKICQHTHEEYKLKLLKQAYNKSQKRLFSDERDSPESRNSGSRSACDRDSDLNSIDSTSKEPFFYRSPHPFLRFGVGGKVVYLDPEQSVCAVRISDAKNFFLDNVSQRNIDTLDSFEGPLVIGHTPPQSVLLFIQHQIDRIRRSDVYRNNQQSGDANDCLLIWKLLDMLVRQQGKITGPDLANLLVDDYSYSSFSASDFVRGSTERVNGGIEIKNEQNVNTQAMDKFTQYLLGGHIEKALESAMRDGLLFDAYFLANRMFRNNPKKLSEIEAKLLQYRAPEHPVITLLSVAGETVVPPLVNTADDTFGWRAHIAIILANLQTPAAIKTVYEMGLALAKKEFNSAADFCFLAVNLLTGYDCFNDSPRAEASDDDECNRRHIKLISASLPDYDSTQTAFGLSIPDYQATEIFEYTQSMVAKYPLSISFEFQKCRLQYAKMLGEYGGFASNVSQYCTQIARAIWYKINEIDKAFLSDLCDMADRYRYVGNCDDCSWISSLRQYCFPSAPAMPNVNEQAEFVHQENQAARRESQVTYREDSVIHREDSMTNHYDNKVISNEICDPPIAVSTPLVDESMQYASDMYPERIDNHHQEEKPMNNHAFDHPPIAVSTPVIPESAQYSPVPHVPYTPPPHVDRQEDKVVNNEVFDPPIGQMRISTPSMDSLANIGKNRATDKEKQMNGGGGGILNGLKNRFVKYIPSSNSMFLPDDGSPQIRWDSDLGRYVGDGVEQEYECPPPPVGIPTTAMTNDPPVGSATPSNNPPLNDNQVQSSSLASMMPLPIPDGATIPVPATTKKNGRLPQKRYLGGF